MKGWKIALQWAKWQNRRLVRYSIHEATKPWVRKALHAAEMNQDNRGEDMNREPLVLHKTGKQPQIIQVVSERGGHCGGAQKDCMIRSFKTPDAADPYKHAAG